MTILSTDIKLRESERMTDTSDGGGRRTNNLIVDGVAGNIFPKVSRLDSVYGRVNLREVFGHVDTANQDTYAGAHFIVTDAPDNDRIHVTAFSIDGEYADRTAARDRIESYVVAGPVSRMTLYGRQLIGSQAILVYQREEEPLPEIGSVFAVSTEVGSVTQTQQFFSLQNVAHELRTFTDSQGDFVRRVLTITVGSALRYEFTGPATPLRASGTNSTGVVRSTTVADVAHYFGIKPLSIAASINDLDVKVPSIFTPLVPSTQREAALSLVPMAGVNFYVTSGPEVSISGLIIRGSLFDNSRSWNLGSAITPGSVRIHGFAPGYPSVGIWDWVDDGNGIFPSGTVNYETGEVTMQRYDGWNGYESYTFTFDPVVAVSQASHTQSIDITLATRGTVYSVPVLPVPAAGTLSADYRALGKWYRLQDDGTGALVGSSAAYGTGTVDLISGGVTPTLGALPDVGSSLILTWGSTVHFEVVTADANPHALLKTTLTNLPVKRGSLVCTYYVNAVAHTASAASSNIISGDNSVTGKVDLLTGAVELQFGDKLPDAGSAVSFAYSQNNVVTLSDELIIGGTFSALTASTLTNAPFEPGSVSVTAPISTTKTGEYYAPTVLTGSVPLTDDGSGNLYVRKGTAIATGLTVDADTVVGTIVYATGAIALSNAAINSAGVAYVSSYSSGGHTYPTAGDILSTVSVPYPRTGHSAITSDIASWRAIGSGLTVVDVSKTHTVDLSTSGLTVDLLTTKIHPVVPGSVSFNFAGNLYYERNGVLYCDKDNLDNTNTLVTAGSFNYATGDATVLDWRNDTAIGLSVHTCLTSYGDHPATEVQFRTAGSPLRPASMYVQANDEDGVLLTGTCDVDGIITGAAMVGKVEQTMGVAVIAFGAMVTAAGHETEAWFDAAKVVGGQIWRPRRVLPGTIRYSAVVLSNLPLNADLLGLDPVRLPSDGKVPIFRPADVAVVHHTGSYNAGTPIAGSTLNVGRANLDALWLEDSARKKLAGSLYSANLTAGTVELAADLSLTGYTAPISAKHRIEQMVLLSDVQLNGTLSLSAPLTKDFPLGSLVSSALLFGDLFAHVTNVFDQATWTGVWSDTLIGSGAPAQYNDIDYPIEVLNSSAVSDRWRISFTSTTAFQVISENLGVIGTGDTSTDCAIVNQLTGQAYFTLRHAGWGSGWSVGNQLRFKTLSASPPTWLVRTVLPGATLSGDSFDAQLRGDVD